MLNKEKHQLIMGRILKDIYTNVAIAPLLGLKGGTCAYFFYGLPRFSVDLDFDLLAVNEKNQQLIFKKILDILKNYGDIKDRYLKKYTIFALLSYGAADHNVKIEINLRQWAEDIQTHYELREYLGITTLAGKKDYLFAGKLVALTARAKTAMRDIYDVHYFAKNNWDINSEMIKRCTGKSVKEYAADCAAFIARIKDSQMLQGLGELIDAKEKAWVKNNLKAETVFLLKNYSSALQ